jgi:hypothetical protein
VVTGTVSSAIFYYGLDVPADRARSARIRGARVVLQPYHPLLTADRFADYFPHSSLFVYWNPTGVPATALPDAGEPLGLLDPDPVWNLARLDLRCAAARRFAAGQGLRALHGSGSSVTGLFVDDLDLWSGPDQQDAALAVVSSVLEQAGRPVRLFVNRAFALWRQLACIDAVLLEELTPGLVNGMSPDDVRWVQQCVLPAVREVRRRGAAVFGLTYQPSPEASPLLPASAKLAALCDGVLHGRRSLDIWPEEVR